MFYDFRGKLLQRVLSLSFHCVEPDEMIDLSLFLTSHNSRVPRLDFICSGEGSSLALWIVVGLLGAKEALQFFAKWSVNVSVTFYQSVSKL